MLRAYRGRGRRYHNLDHIEACLQVVYRHFSSPEHVRHGIEVELALWFHDVVYTPGAPDNEERSAAWFRDLACAQSGLVDACAVSCAILATKHHEAQGLVQECTVDADLSILGEAAAVFDTFERAIRYEYGFVPARVYCAGRRAVLESFLRRAFIYATPECRHVYEAQARINLARAIERLGRGEPTP